MSTSEADRTHARDLIKRVERRVAVRGIFAMLTTVTPLFVGGFIAAPDIVAASSLVLFKRLFIILIAVVIGVGIVGYVAGAVGMTARSVSWVRDGREPTTAERRKVTRLAWQVTLFVAPAWVMGMIMLVPLSRVLTFASAVMIPLAVLGITVAGLVAVAFAYVLVDDALRPLYALALGDPQIRPDRTVGLLPRFWLYWVVGSGLNLFATALVLIILPDTGRRIALVFCVFGAIVGAGLTIVAARSVTDRVEGLLAGVQRVQEGDLETAAAVDDLGEIGRLQRGFNEMVAGLRERQRLGDLFGRHVGADVARRALEGRGLEGSERHVSVLFIDVIGSTTLATDRPPAEVVLMLNALFDAVVRAVGAEGGLVNQFQGDGALCVFGAPIAAPDHADRALRATRVLVRDVGLLRETFRGFDAAIGVSSGAVVAGDIGNADRYQYTVIGDPVNEASRLCDEAKLRSGRALASSATIESAGSGDGWVPGGDVALRGRLHPTAVYELPA